MSDATDPPQQPDWQRLKDLVADALELAPSERDAFIRESDADESTKRRVLEIVHSDAHGGFIHPRVDAFVGLSGPNPSQLAGQRLGRYTLVRLIGEGAMSAVYLAQQDGVDRPVALKVLRRAALSYDARRRFAREVAAHGRIAHPGVAALIDAGVAQESSSPGDPSGVAYIAMEWIDGVPLTHWARQRQLSLHDKLRLLADVADAVHAAHQRAILHRDLKPANVLVVDNGSYGQPKVLDFGIASILDESAANAPDRTTAGILMGTLGYMSPEQARGETLADVRSDVYALGVLLHELLVLRLPVDVSSASLTRALAQLAEPSISREQIGPIEGDTTAGDLHAILLTALASEPKRRYPSAAALAEDLRRVVNDQPVAARLPTRTYVLRKFVRRHRLPIAAGAAVAVALLAGFGVALVALSRESKARRIAVESESKALASLERATLQTRRAESARGFVTAMLESADVTAPGGAAQITLLDAIRAAEPELQRHVAGDPVVEADVRRTLARALRGLNSIDDADAQFVAAIAAARSATAEPGDYAQVTMIDLNLDRLIMLANDTRIEPARSVLKEVRAIIDQSTAPEPRKTAWRITADMGQAAILQADGDAARSSEIYADVLARAEAFAAQHGPTSFISADELSTIQNNAATAFIDAGDSARAAEVLSRVVAYRAQRFGPAHPTSLAAMRNRAASLDRLGSFDEAALLATDVLTKAVAALGPDHLIAISARDTLISIAAQRQSPPELERALALADANLAALERAGQTQSAEMVLQLANRGNLLGHLKRLDESAECYGRALKLGLAMLGPEHPYVLSSRSNLGNALALTGRLEEGTAHMREVLAIRRRLLGDEHRATLATRNSLAMLAVEANDAARCADSLAELQQCIEIAERNRYATLVPSLRRNQGRALIVLGDLERAESTLRKAYEEGAAVSAAHQQRTATLLADLAVKRNDEPGAARWRGLATSATTQP